MSANIMAVDPGTTESAYVIVTPPSQEFRLLDFGKVPNDDLKRRIAAERPNYFVIEMVASYGMAVGQSTFETVFWTGRFWQIASDLCTNNMARLYRKTDICMHLCHSTRARDSNIRQALIDKLGEPGTQKNPGPLYGVAGDVWSALAVAVTYRDRLETAK